MGKSSFFYLLRKTGLFVFFYSPKIIKGLRVEVTIWRASCQDIIIYLHKRDGHMHLKGKAELEDVSCSQIKRSTIWKSSNYNLFPFEPLLKCVWASNARRKRP